MFSFRIVFTQHCCFDVSSFLSMHSYNKILRRTAQTMPPVRRCTSSLASPSRKVSRFPSLSSAADKQKRTAKTMRPERNGEKKRACGCSLWERNGNLNHEHKYNTIASNDHDVSLQCPIFTILTCLSCSVPSYIYHVSSPLSRDVK